MSGNGKRLSLLAEIEAVSRLKETLHRQLQSLDSIDHAQPHLSVNKLFPLGEQYFFQFMNNLPAMSYIKDLQGRYVFLNQSYAQLLGAQQSEFIGKTAFDIWPADVSRILVEEDRKVFSTGNAVTSKQKLHLDNGTELTVLIAKFPIEVDGEIVALGGFAVDTSSEARALAALRESENRYRTMVENTYDCESWVGEDGRIIYVNSACERITGYSAQEFMKGGEHLEKMLHRDDVPSFREYIRTSRTRDTRSPDFRMFRKDGKVRWVCMVSRVVHDDEGAPQGVRYSLRDITDRKLMEKQLEYEALHDPLTGLPNRALCLDRLHQATVRALRREEYYYAVVFVDLDRFKIINDSLGHAFGDRVLQEVGLRLLRSVRDFDTVCRFGGDEFVLLLEELDRPREAIRVIRRIRRVLAEPFDIDGRKINLSASYGLVLGPSGESETPDSLVQNANIALHRAKDGGPNRLKVFNSKMLVLAQERMTLEEDMRHHIGNGAFYLEYQPIYSLKNSKLIGFEALVRWNHPEKGELLPVDFIPLAEDCGLINDLGQWVLEEACSTMVRWRDRLPEADSLLMSVNVSGKQFSRFDLADRVKRVLRDTGLPPHCLKLEITESSIMENAEHAIDTLGSLKAMGLKVSIDDFGTGYSSMSYLQRFPLDHLKIDLSFVQGMDSSNENMEIVKTIINLAHNLGLKVIAEGVEKEEHKMLLNLLDCEYGQGYFFSRPVAEEAARGFIRPLVN